MDELKQLRGLTEKIASDQKGIIDTQKEILEKMQKISGEYDAMSDRMVEAVDTLAIKVSQDVNSKFDHYFLELSKRQIDYEKINRYEHEEFRKDIDYIKRFGGFNYFVFKNAIWFISAIVLLVILVFILLTKNYEKSNFLRNTSSFHTSCMLGYYDKNMA